MAFNYPIQVLPIIIALLFTPILALAPNSPPPAADVNCSDELVAFSPCLPFISTLPNNLTLSPSSRCCEVYSRAFNSGVAGCLCYFVRRPLLLGFPLNSTRLLSLSSVCPLEAGSKANDSLDSLCSGSATLPPLPGIIGPRIPKPRDSGRHDSPPPSLSSLPDPVDTAPPATASSSTSTTLPSSLSLPPPMIPSAAAKQNIGNSGKWFPFKFGLLILFLVLFFTNP